MKNVHTTLAVLLYKAFLGGPFSTFNCRLGGGQFSTKNDDTMEYLYSLYFYRKELNSFTFIYCEYVIICM